jgi:hypothetical protein
MGVSMEDNEMKREEERRAVYYKPLSVLAFNRTTD